MNDAESQAIRLFGVRHNNLKNFDLVLPTGRLIVVTGLSGSGKSSLAFDTLFAEGQRRYIETFSPYARQFFDRMDKPRVDRIEGIPPAIAIEQTNNVRTTRSTVGTMTEICDYMKILWPHLARLHCRQCGRPVRKESPALVWETVQERKAEGGGRSEGHGMARGDAEGLLREATVPYRADISQAAEVIVTFDLPLSDKLSLDESLSLVSRQGYQRILAGQEIVRVEEAARHAGSLKKSSLLTVVQDRIRLEVPQRSRFMEACEQAYHFGKGRLRIHPLDARAGIGAPRSFSSHLHCAECDLDYRDPTPALFSFNHPLGACPNCKGFGRIISIDYQLAMPDRTKTLAGGVVKPWQTGQGAECQADLLKFCRKNKVPTDVPFHQLPKTLQDWVIDGDPQYGQDAAHEWPRAWYGVKGYFRWLESKAYKMHVRVLLSRYRAYSQCPACQGRRFQPETLLYRCLSHPASQDKVNRGVDAAREDDAAGALTLADFYALPVHRAVSFIESRAEMHSKKPSDPIGLALTEVRHRLAYLEQVGLGYLTLDRPTRTLSGGETERVNLTTCLGSRLVNTLFVLDEPSVGLHARDTGRLVCILENLKNTGNTVVVVEHEPSVMRAADQIIDLGPGHGESGGEIVFQGPLDRLLKNGDSLTGQYLSGRKIAALPAARAVQRDTPSLMLSGANRNNLRDLTVRLPLQRFVCLTGVSGSGKSTLVRDCLLPALQDRLQSQAPAQKASDRLDDEADNEGEKDESSGGAGLSVDGWRSLGRVVMVDQSPLGKTPRSNPAVYVGAFEEIRELFAQTDPARQRGLKASAFSFNSAQGQCERCRGAGFEKIEMQFLSDVFVRCPDCDGRRYRDHILEIKLPVAARKKTERTDSAWSIADVLEASVDEAMEALLPYAHSATGQKAVRKLKPLQEVGLGYLRLGQPINTLSGGESQRLKLASYLAESAEAEMRALTPRRGRAVSNRTAAPGNDARVAPALFIFDEPTTGLHYHDVHVLLQAFQKLVEAGHSLLVVEHNLDVIRSADWIIDLGPEGGEAGGAVVAEGTVEEVMACAESHTGRALREG